MKATCGSGFLGTLLYALHGHRDQGEDKQAHIVGGNMCGTTARTLSKEFGQLRKLRPNLGKAVSHFSLSFSPDERALDDAALSHLADEFMAGMGFEHSAYVVVRHGDTAHQHIHIIASRATTTGKTVSDSHTFRRAEAVARRLEIAHGLIPFTPTKETKMHNQTPQFDNNDICKVHEMPGEDWVCGVECGDELSPKRTREIRRETMTAEDYRQRLIALLGADFLKLQVVDYGLIISFTHGGRLIDRGDSVKAYRMGDEQAAKHLVAIGLVKGWSSMKFSGSPDFLRMAFIEAMAQGILIVPRDEEQQRILQAVTEEAKQKLAAAKATTAEAAAALAALTIAPEKSLEEEAKESATALRALHIQNLKAPRPLPAPVRTGPPLRIPMGTRPALSGMGSLGARLQGQRDENAGPEDERKGPRLGPR